jgi:hypothetical protein
MKTKPRDKELNKLVWETGTKVYIVKAKEKETEFGTMSMSQFSPNAIFVRNCRQNSGIR